MTEQAWILRIGLALGASSRTPWLEQKPNVIDAGLIEPY
jgi:hypothetical protein